ncbi:RnfABCDGE type electron transport complex subunit B [Vibrio sp. PP-XX7]
MMVFASVGFFVVLGAILGLALGYAGILFRVENDPLIDQVASMLPGGQCGQCGEAGCRQAAEKIVRGELSPMCCPPGGASLAMNIAEQLGLSVAVGETVEWIARIDEEKCSGCHRCYKACPFDAIVGAPKQMHTVIQDICTGCRLCEAACVQQCLVIEESIPEPSVRYWPKPNTAAVM